MDTFNSHTEPALRQAMLASARADITTLIEQGRYPPPWDNGDYVIQQDEGRLLAAIADNAGLEWHSGIPRICQRVADLLGMVSVGNAKATVKRCIQLGYVRARPDKELGMIMLDLTDLGAAMLELWQDDEETE